MKKNRVIQITSKRATESGVAIRGRSEGQFSRDWWKWAAIIINGSHFCPLFAKSKLSESRIPVYIPLRIWPLCYISPPRNKILGYKDNGRNRVIYSCFVVRTISILLLQKSLLQTHFFKKWHSNEPLIFRLHHL